MPSIFKKSSIPEDDTKFINQFTVYNTDYELYFDFETNEPIPGPHPVQRWQNNYFKPYYTLVLEKLDFDSYCRLSFVVTQNTYKPKIECYRQINNVRHRIYSKQPSVTTKKFFKFNNVINVQMFCNYQILKLKIPTTFQKTICRFLKTEPEWLRISNQIDRKNIEIQDLNKQFKTFVPEQYKLKPENAKEQPSNFKLRLFLAFFTFGLSFIGYVSPTVAEQNKQLNLANHQYNIAEKNAVDERNVINKTKIEESNHQIHQNIVLLKKEIESLTDRMNHPEVVINDDGEWKKILDGMQNPDTGLADQIGVYVIWNRTKNKYYVGQTHNLYKRIFTQHFDLGNHDVKNIIFARDWFNGDEFYYKVIPLENEALLNQVERDNISKYDAYVNGYNKTSGNL